MGKHTRSRSVGLSSQNYMGISETRTTSKSLTLPVSRVRIAMNVNPDRNLVNVVNANYAASLRTVRISWDADSAYLLISGHELLNCRQRSLKYCDICD